MQSLYLLLQLFHSMHELAIFTCLSNKLFKLDPIIQSILLQFIGHMSLFKIIIIIKFFTKRV